MPPETKQDAPEASGGSRKKPPSVVSAGIIAQLSVALVTALVVPLLAGIWISRTFDLGPVAVVCVVSLGLALGAAAVVRIIQNAYDQLGGGK
jgi:F0F1-type ATP synthase assembly protein I